MSLFLEIRGYQIAPGEDTVDRINRLYERKKSSASLLEIYVANSTARSEKANDAEQRQDRILCRFRDNGPSIEPRYQERVFWLFERLDTEISGTGVGLALVKRIAEFHNGKVRVEAQGDGQGCCFCFTLPVQRGT
jgi:signal transduction histidine kinase